MQPKTQAFLAGGPSHTHIARSVGPWAVYFWKSNVEWSKKEPIRRYCSLTFWTDVLVTQWCMYAFQIAATHNMQRVLSLTSLPLHFVQCGTTNARIAKEQHLFKTSSTIQTLSELSRCWKLRRHLRLSFYVFKLQMRVSFFYSCLSILRASKLVPGKWTETVQ